MNQMVPESSIDELLHQLDELATRLKDQTLLLNHNLDRIQAGVKVLNHQLHMLGEAKEPESH